MLTFRLRLVSAAFVAASAVMALGSSAAHAQTILNPLNSVTPPPTVSPFGGTLLATSSSAYTGTNAGQTITGRLLSAVYSGGTVNGTLGGTSLDFYYQLFLDAGSAGIVDQSTSISSFAGFTTAVGQSASAPTGSGFSSGGVASAQAQRSGGAGPGLTFDFGSGIPVGQLSQTLVVRTNAVNFSNTGGAAVLSATGVSANTAASVLAPTATASAAPEPGTLPLIGTGLVTGLGMVGTLSRKRETVRRRKAKLAA